MSVASSKLLVGNKFLSKRFLPFVVTQFLGAFNDNFYRSALLVGFTFGLLGSSSLEAATFVTLAGGIFIFPFVLFSPLAGKLGDIYDKATVIRYTKLLELLIVVLVMLAFWVDDTSLFLLVLFLLGVQSSFFGPMKYSILSHHVERSFLNGANGVVVFTTFIAILLGTIAGNAFVVIEGGTLWLLAVMLMVALVGVFSAFLIPAAPPYGFLPSERHHLLTLTKMGLSDMVAVLRVKRLFYVMLANSWFWGISSLMVALLAPLSLGIAVDVPELVNILFISFIVGVGFGVLMMRLFRKMVAHRCYLLSCLGLMGLLLLDLGIALSGTSGNIEGGLSAVLTSALFWRIELDLFFLASCGGAFCVPLYTELQLNAKDETRSQVFATTNVINSLLIVVCSLLSSLLFGLGFTMSEVLFALAMASGGMGICCLYTLGQLQVLE